MEISIPPGRGNAPERAGRVPFFSVDLSFVLTQNAPLLRLCLWSFTHVILATLLSGLDSRVSGSGGMFFYLLEMS